MLFKSYSVIVYKRVKRVHESLFVLHVECQAQEGVSDVILGNGLFPALTKSSCLFFCDTDAAMLGPNVFSKHRWGGRGAAVGRSAHDCKIAGSIPA